MHDRHFDRPRGRTRLDLLATAAAACLAVRATKALSRPRAAGHMWACPKRATRVPSFPSASGLLARHVFFLCTVHGDGRAFTPA